MSTVTETTHSAEFLLSEAPGQRSREAVTVLSGQTLEAGEVVGRVTKGVGRVSVPTVVGTGDGTASLVFAGPNVEVGSYVLTCTAAVAHGGVFSLTTPSGLALPALTLTPGAGGTTAYTSDHINFTITDGSTDFAAADVFTFVVGTTAPTVIGTGNGTISAITLGRAAKTGRYKVVNLETITNGGRFECRGPDGDALGEITITAGAGGTGVFTSDQLNFTLTDATDFVAGDFFEVAAYNQLAGGKCVEWNPASVDGRQHVAGVLYAAVDASAADASGVLVARDAEVDTGLLAYATTITAANKADAVAALARDLRILAR